MAPIPVRIRRLAWRVTAGIWLVYLSTAGGSLATKDAVVMFEQTRQMIDHHTFALPVQVLGERSHVGVDGRSYSPFGIGQSIYNIPFFLAARAASAVGVGESIPEDALAKAVVALGGTVAAAAVGGLSLLLAWRLTGDVYASVVSAVLVAFGTLLWPYSKFGFNAPLAALGVLAGVYFSVVAGSDGDLRAALVAGISVSLALLTRHELILMTIPISLWWWRLPRVGERQKAFAAFAVGIFAGLVCSGTYNFVRFGSALRAGYQPAFGGNGLLGLLLSPEGSLVLYMPIAIAGLCGLALLIARHVRAAALVGLVSVTLFAFYASLADWLGTRSYGPRYLVALAPLLVAPTAVLLTNTTKSRTRKAALALGVLSMVVQIPAVLVDFTKVRIAALAQEGHVVYRAADRSFAASTLSQTARRAIAMVPANLTYVTGQQEPPAASRDASLSDRFAFSLNLWWMYLFYMHVLGAASALVAGLTPLAVGSWLIGSAVMQARAMPAASADV